MATRDRVGSFRCARSDWSMIATGTIVLTREDVMSPPPNAGDDHGHPSSCEESEARSSSIHCSVICDNGLKYIKSKLGP